jgi:hypothetical protein
VSTNVQRLGNLQVHEGCTVYLIERELTTMAELEAIVTDYLQQAETWGRSRPPGRAACSPSCRRSTDDRPPPPQPRHHPNPADRAELTEQDLAIASLVGRLAFRDESRDTHRRRHDRAAPGSVSRSGERGEAPRTDHHRESQPYAAAESVVVCMSIVGTGEPWLRVAPIRV